MIRQLTLGATALALALQTVHAQAVVTQTDPQGRQVERIVLPRTLGNRVLAGVTVSSATTPRDTLGLLVSAVTPGSAAEKAGLVEGNRIAAINGVNLKLHAADAGQMDMQGIMSRRFQREMSKVKPGDPVRFNVYAENRFRDVTVQTEALKPSTFHPFLSEADAGRASLGAIVGGTATVRDTLGVLVNEVAENGPLAKNGIYEGSRIATIGSVDLRVPVASAGDAKVSSDKANLLVTELSKATAGGNVTLRVYEGGRFRNVTVQTMRRGDVEMPGSAGNIMLHRGGNIIRLNELPEMGGALQNFRLRLDSATQRLNHHVIVPPHVDESVRLRLEQVLPDLRLQLQQLQPNLQLRLEGLGERISLPIMLNSRLIAASNK